jgi:hypothetical protein
MNINNSDDDLGAQVAQVGYEFNPGREADTEIDNLLGFETFYLGADSYRKLPDAVQMCPAYCEDQELCQDILNQESAWATILPTVCVTKKTDKFVQEYVALFCHKQAVFITVPFETTQSAYACALWFVLQDKSEVT